MAEAAEPERLATLPYIIRVFLENVLRHQDRGAGPEHIEALLSFRSSTAAEFPFHPARVVLQDLTGVPVVADLTAVRAAVARLGGDADAVNPKVPVDLVCDHSVIIDFFGGPDAYARNVEREYERNMERYGFLRWAQTSYEHFRVVPPGAGIVHQVNLEYLASVVMTSSHNGTLVAFPDTLVGADSHTTMIGGLGVLGWGVGGIEAEAGMLGEPVAMAIPEVVGVQLTGHLPEGTTATDLVLAVTELLREHGVVGKFVEFYGPGLASLTVADRATIANMSPEYGATEGVFPVDEQTLTYLRSSGRADDHVDLVERYMKAQGLFVSPDDPEPTYNEALVFDLATVEPSLAGPSRPQDRVALTGLRERFRSSLERSRATRGPDPSDIRRRTEPEIRSTTVEVDGRPHELRDGSVVIAAITSCTNTSNPSVMIGAGLLARNAVERGLVTSPIVKTSLAPGSKVVTDYLDNAGLSAPLSKLGFDLVGYGCTTCIGNSGPLPEPVAAAIEEHGLTCASVLSGNRNFEGRIHPQARMSFLASPPLVVAYALAGSVDIDLETQPLQTNADGEKVFLSDIWPSADEIATVVADAMDPDDFRQRYAHIFDGDEHWNTMDVPAGDIYAWNPASTYLREPPFVSSTTLDVSPPTDILGARALVYVGDAFTTDHISPAAPIPASSPAGRWLLEQGVDPNRLHSYGARRGNHEVMVRGTFANIRVRNRLAGDKEGGYTTYLGGGTGSGEVVTVYEAAERYRADGTPLVVLGGHEYGIGSSRDWAAKGTMLLGIRAVLAASFERIHRTNLIQMGVLPLELPDTPDALGLHGTERFDILLAGLSPRQMVPVHVTATDGSSRTIEAVSRLDTPTDVRYFEQGGILPAVVRELA